MLRRNPHPTDEELLSSADGELSQRGAARIRTHLAACWECRARMAAIEGTIADFTRAHHQSVDSSLPPVDGPRALLRAQLADLASRPHAPARPWLIQMPHARFTAVALGTAVLAMLLSGGYFLRRSARGAGNAMAASPVEKGSAPDPALTPGVVRMVKISDVCSMPHEEVTVDVPPPLQQQVLREYGVAEARPHEYEIDYLIAPGLGGTEDIHNLWPEPYNARTWNARVKDSLEEHLHQLVCAGKLDLPTAQHDIATDWIAAYKKYFHTNTPLAASAMSGLT